MTEIVKWAVLGLFLYLVANLFNHMAQKAKEEKEAAGVGSEPGEGSETQGESPPTSSADQKSSDEDHPGIGERADREEKAKAERLKGILERDPSLAPIASKEAGLGDLDIEKLLDPEMLRRLAREIPDEVLEILDYASRDMPFDFDLDSTSKLKEVTTGGVLTQPGRMKTWDKISRVRLTEQLLPKSLRRYRLATGDAEILRRFDLQTQQKLMYALEDASGSMEQALKYLKARGVIIKLALNALKGKSRFVHRSFQENVSEMWRVTNPKEAQAFLDFAFRGFTGGGGTNILHALQVAVRDIRKKEKGVDKAGILLVSDGEDESISDPQELIKLLGDIELHVVMIGAENPSLKAVAKSYTVLY